MPYGKVWRTSYIFGQKLFYGQNEGRPHTHDKDYQGVTVRREKELVGSDNTIIDWDRFNQFNISVGADTTVSSVINPRENSDFIVLLTKDNSATIRTLSFPSDWDWADSTAPSSMDTANEQIVFKVTYFGGVYRAYRDPMQQGIDVFTSSTAGSVPASGGGTVKFLRADGNWIDPSLSGVLPSGGSSGEALVKASNADYDVEWATFGGGVTDGDKGDVEVTGSGLVWTIGTGVVTLAQMADIATSTFIGRTTAGTGVPQALTATQATALLNVASASTKGLVPAPSASPSSTKYLAEDMTYQTITSGSSASVLLASTSLGAGTSYTISSSTIAQAYKYLKVILKGMSHNSGSNQTFTIELSGNNGSTWSTALTISRSYAASIGAAGEISIYNADVTSGDRIISASLCDANGNTLIATDLTNSVTTGYVNAIRIKPTGGNFDAGTIALIGWE